MTRVLFVVGGGTQWDDALRIAAELPGANRLLDLGTLTVTSPPPPGTPYPGRHWPEQGLRVVLELTRILRRELREVDALVLGQDAGRLQRVAARVARKASVPFAVVPDGALFDSRAAIPLRARAEEAALRGSGLTIGEPLRFGSTAPDLWCAWGDGWVPLLEQFSPRGSVAVTGSPRAAALATIRPARPQPERILLCSQPTWVHPFPPSETAGGSWYRWLDRIVCSAPAGAVRVRLHPRERDIHEELELSPAVLDAATSQSSLADDLADSDAVVAPFSTVLIEAAATGRGVVSVVPERACVAVRDTSPAMADPALSVRVVDELPDLASVTDALVADGAINESGARYARIAPDTAARCATAITALGRR